jgi:hypothetical protein
MPQVPSTDDTVSLATSAQPVLKDRSHEANDKK